MIAFHPLFLVHFGEIRYLPIVSLHHLEEHTPSLLPIYIAALVLVEVFEYFLPLVFRSVEKRQHLLFIFSFDGDRLDRELFKLGEV